ADAEQPVEADVGPAQRVAYQLLREVQALDRGMVDVGRRPVVDDGLAGEVADRDTDVLVPEVEPDRVGGAWDERERGGRAARAARARVAGALVLLDDPGARELVDQPRDRRARQARALSE